MSLQVIGWIELPVTLPKKGVTPEEFRKLMEDAQKEYHAEQKKKDWRYGLMFNMKGCERV